MTIRNFIRIESISSLTFCVSYTFVLKSNCKMITNNEKKIIIEKKYFNNRNPSKTKNISKTN